MSQGTLFTTSQVRGIAPIALIKHFKLDIKISDKEDPIYKSNFPLNKIPSFIGPKGFKLHEVIAILIYFISIGDENSSLLGKNKKEYALILKWLSFTNSEILVTAAQAFRPLLGLLPYNKKQVDEALAKSDSLAEILEDRLIEFTYLVGERLTLADIFCSTIIGKLFDTIWAKDFIAKHPGIYRWFKLVMANDILKDCVYGSSFEIRETPIEFVPPKKEKKQQQPKAAKPAAAPKPKLEEDDQPVEEKKPKHPLELLGKSKVPIDEWKRVYSNKETREEALPWFWDNFYDSSQWSLYKVGYKYNDELTLTFMSNNLVGGFFNRLSASTKYMFGCLVVYGENNNNGIVGAFLVRGEDFKPAFEVAPDWESYEYSKLDASKPEDREFINDMWAWDKPVIVNGESKEIADGKVFK